MKSNTEYSTDAKTAVITMDLTGGFRVPVPPDFKRQPWLQVFGDGRIVCGSQVPNLPSNEGRLTPAQLQELANWLVQEQKVLELTAEKISRELEGYQSLMADGLTTSIKIQLAKESREFSVYTLRQTAGDLPDAKGLQVLASIETRLRAVRRLGDIGSQEILDSALQAANQHLEQELPDANPWTTDHLRMVERQPNGGLTLTFSRAKSISGDGYTLSLKLSRKAADQPWNFEFESR